MDHSSQIENISQPAPPQKPTNWLLIATIIILLFLTAAGTYFFLTMQQKATEVTPLPQAQTKSKTIPTLNDTSNWKTYTNSKYGYSISYEPGVEIKESSRSTNLKKPSETANEDFGNGYNINIEVIENKKNLSSKEYILEYANGKLDKSCNGIGTNAPEYIVSSCKFNQQISENIINSFKEYKNGEINGIIGNIDGYENPNITVIYSKNNKIYQFLLQSASGTGSPIQKPHEIIFKQILSTFKFLPASPSQGGDQNKTLDTSNWKTYTNTKYGFSLKYPAELVIKEEDTQTAHRQYIEDCNNGKLSGCGGLRWPEYKIDFSNSTNGGFVISIHVMPIVKGLLGNSPSNISFEGKPGIKNGTYFGVENEGFSYIITPHAKIGDDIDTKIEFVNQVVKTFQFIETDKPLSCLWTPEFVGVDINKISEDLKKNYQQTNGYFYNSKSNSCGYTSVYVWTDKDFTPQKAANIPFSAKEECEKTCL